VSANILPNFVHLRNTFIFSRIFGYFFVNFFQRHQWARTFCQILSIWGTLIFSSIFWLFFREFLLTPSHGVFFYFFLFFDEIISIPQILKQILTPSRFWAFGPKSFGGRIWIILFSTLHSKPKSFYSSAPELEVTKYFELLRFDEKIMYMNHFFAFCQ